MQKIPYMLVVGDQEVEDEAVNVRKYGEQKSEISGFPSFATINVETLKASRYNEKIFA